MKIVALDKELLSRVVWYLDFDGSVCPHQEIWEERTYNPEEIFETVKSLAKRSQGLFWNTGRRVESLGSVNESFLDFPGYFVHASIEWNPGSKKSRILSSQLTSEISTWAKEKFDSNSAVKLEIKPTGLRLTPSGEKSKQEFLKVVTKEKLKEFLGWTWYLGPRGAELLAENFNKGAALKRSLPNFKNAVPVIIGDDFMDSHAAREAFNNGGYAILVGPHCGWITELKHLPSQVIYFNEPREVLRFLSELVS